MPLVSAPSNNAFLSIRYPTDGRIKFFTERHRYRDTQGVTHPAGGMRIARIDYYDADGNAPVRQKIYRYGKDEDGCGVMKLQLNFNETFGNCVTTQLQHYYYRTNDDRLDNYASVSSERKRPYLPHPIFSGDCDVGNWVCYSQVSEYDSEDGSISYAAIQIEDVRTARGISVRGASVRCGYARFRSRLQVYLTRYVSACAKCVIYLSRIL